MAMQDSFEIKSFEIWPLNTGQEHTFTFCYLYNYLVQNSTVLKFKFLSLNDFINSGIL